MRQIAERAKGGVVPSDALMNPGVIQREAKVAHQGGADDQHRDRVDE